ncbi:hypothetical protein J7E62_24545 [Variovorax paradoxus]|nr:hypothetical protein [Variovorax paradoxus]
MSVARFVARLKRVTDPVEALELIVDNEGYLGYDPYFPDLRKALLDMASRVAANQRKKR